MKEPSANTNRSAELSGLPLMLTLGVFLVAIVQRSLSPTNHDVAWLITFSERMLEGAVPYVDLIEVNPPLLVWLNVPGILLGQGLGIDTHFGVHLTVFALAAISTLLSVHLLRRFGFFSHAMMMVMIAFMLAIFPGRIFAQREHIMVIALLPYLIACAGRGSGQQIGWKMSVIVAGFAALGILLKPYFVLFPALCEIYVLARIGLVRTLKRPEPYVLAACGLAYVAAVFVFTPQYFSRIVLYAREVYQIGYGESVGITIRAARFFGLAAVCVAVIAYFFRDRVQHRPVLDVLLMSVLAGLAVYLIQQKSWQYQIFPALTFLCMIGLLILIDHWRAVMDVLPSKLRFSAVVLIFLGTVGQPLVKFDYKTKALGQRQLQLAQFPDAQSVLIMSANVYQGFPVVPQSGLQWASRFPTLWLTPGLVLRRKEIGGTTPLLDEIEAYNRQAVAEDMVKYKPDLVFVDMSENKSHFKKHPFDYIEHFSAHPLFAQQWASYRFHSQADD